MAGGNNRRALENKANELIHTFHDIRQGLVLKLNIQKCVVMMFLSNRMENKRPLFRIQSVSIPVNNNVKYLCFLFDSKFNWLDNFEEVKESIMNFLINIEKTGLRDKGLRTEFKKI